MTIKFVTTKKEEKPTNTLAAALANIGKPKVHANIPALQNAKTATANLQNMLTTKSEQVEKPIQLNAIQQLAPKTEKLKYILTANATEKLPEEVLIGFQNRMQKICDCFGSADVQHALYAILEYTKQHPELREILKAEDVAIFVKAAREAYGIVLVNKTANKEKKGKTGKLEAELLSDLADLEINL